MKKKTSAQAEHAEKLLRNMRQHKERIQEADAKFRRLRALTEPRAKR
jgi:hypothetical protein